MRVHEVDGASPSFPSLECTCGPFRRWSDHREREPSIQKIAGGPILIQNCYHNIGKGT